MSAPCDGAGNTTLGGANYLLSDTDAGGVGSATTFTIDDAVFAFGFDYTDFEGAAGLLLLRKRRFS